MTDLENVSQTCFNCSGSRIKEEEHDGAARYTCLQCGEEWSLDASQSAPNGSKKHRPTDRLAKTWKEAAVIALAAACSTFVCPTMVFLRGSYWDIYSPYLDITVIYFAIVTSVALVAAGLGALLARRVHKILAIALGGILLAGWVALNTYVFLQQ